MSAFTTTPHALLLALFMVSGCASPTPETRWAREERKLVRYEGSTSEPSCGGTGLAVYLNSRGQVRHLDWTMETSRQLIRREYYFEEGEAPTWVIEATHATMDQQNEYLAAARQTSRTRHSLAGGRTNARAQEFLEHSRFLIRDFRTHRRDYRASGPADPG